jgi:hypothetical protein
VRSVLELFSERGRVWTECQLAELLVVLLSFVFILDLDVMMNDLFVIPLSGKPIL